LTEHNYDVIPIEPNTFYKEPVEDIDDGVDCAFHGDDFMFGTTPEEMDGVETMMVGECDIKVLGRLGPGYPGDISILKRTISWTKEGFQWKANVKHANDLVKWAGVESGRAAPTPGTKDTTRNLRDALVELEPVPARGARSASGTLTFLSLDRPDIMFTSRVVGRDMAVPKVRMEARLKRVARYLRGARELIWHFRYQQPVSSLDVVTDSDWAGNEDDRASTSCVVEQHGIHTLDVTVQQQALRALSSTEAEFYGTCSGGARGLHSKHLFGLWMRNESGVTWRLDISASGVQTARRRTVATS